MHLIFKIIQQVLTYRSIRIPLLSQSGSKGRVGIQRYPPAKCETTAGIFVGSARRMDDAIERDKFEQDQFAQIALRVIPDTNKII